jgi:SAM-dependent methyltransferase
MKMPPEITAFYNEGKEAGRLFQGLGLLEFARMQEILSQYLPPAPAVVADIGGGPGTYACWLAGSRYAVHLVDPVPLHVEQAKTASLEQPAYPLTSCCVGDARCVPLADTSVDAVLLHGPLYHLTSRDDRLLALREARRILRPEGVLVAVAISVYASTIVGLVRGWVWDSDYLGMVREEIATGQHRRPPQWDILTTAFFPPSQGPCPGTDGRWFAAYGHAGYPRSCVAGSGVRAVLARSIQARDSHAGCTSSRARTGPQSAHGGSGAQASAPMSNTPPPTRQWSRCSTAFAPLPFPGAAHR